MDAIPKSFVSEHGIAFMDAEHRELARLFDAFAACVGMNECSEPVHNLVQQAIASANAHFEHEEEFMAKTGYPQTEDHKFRHRNLRLQFSTLVGDAVANGAHDPVTHEHLEVLRRLLEDHIAGPDGELAAHLKAAGVK